MVLETSVFWLPLLSGPKDDLEAGRFIKIFLTAVFVAGG